MLKLRILIAFMRNSSSKLSKSIVIFADRQMLNMQNSWRNHGSVLMLFLLFLSLKMKQFHQ